MGFTDVLRSTASHLAGTAGEALISYAADFDPLMKARDDKDVKTGEGPESAPGGSAKDTAENTPFPTQQATDDPKTLFWDPFAIVEQLGFKEKPSQISYGTLKAMIWRTPVIHAVIQTRINQMASFARVSRDRYDLGFRVKLRDTKKAPSKAAQKWIDQAHSMILRTGLTDNPRGRDNFEDFLKKTMWDSLVYDQMAFEVVPNRRGQPVEWYAVDASTIRIADTASTFLNEDDEKSTRHVQIYDGMIISEYNQEELCFGVRNPRTDIRLFGYGVSELEMLITTVTAMLFAFEYNQKAFTQGSAQKGILNFKGAVPERELKSFRRHWYQLCAGVENSWRTPITNAEDLQWISMQQNNREMEYSAFYDFLLKIACAMYLIDPVEVNFKYGNSGQKSTLAEAANKDKIIESKERGLRPLLRFMERNINDHVLWPLNEDFEFAFVGLDAKTRSDVADLNTKLVKSTRTVDELRAEDDLEPLPDGKGEVILDPTWLQYVQGKEAAEQGGEGGPEGGPPGAAPPGAEGGEDDENADLAELLRQQEQEEQDAAESEQEDEETEKSMRRAYVVDLTL